MCRCKDEHSGGRRCPSDTRESRRLRLHKAKAIETYGPLAIKPHPQVEISEEMEKDASTPFSVSNVQNNISSLNSLMEQKEHWTQAAGVPATKEWLLNVDRSLIEIGMGVEYLAETKYGAPTDAYLSDFAEKLDYQKLAIADEYDAQIKDLRQEVNTLRLQVSDLDRDYREWQTNALEAEGLTPQTFPIITERWAEFEKRNPEKFKEVTETKNPADAVINDMADRQRKINSLSEEKFAKIKALELNYNSPLAEAYRKRNEAIKLALQEVGVDFAKSGDLKVSKDSHKKAIKSVDAVTGYYPKEWVEASNIQTENRELRIKDSKGRAHYSNGKWQRGRQTKSYAFFINKPENWKPDPHDRTESEYQPTNEKGEWTDPKNGEVRQDGYPRDGYKTWVQVDYDYKKWNPIDGEAPEKIKGYTEKCEFWEERYDPNTNKYYRTGNLNTYYRKPITRTVTSYESLTAELTVSPSGDSPTNNVATNTSVAVHELAHRMEATNPQIVQMERAFLLRRAGVLGENPESLTTIYKGKKEKGYKDNFITHYMGKVYDGTAYEILSMGMEALFEGTRGGFIGQNGEKRDSDYKRAIIGILASSAKTNK